GAPRGGTEDGTDAPDPRPREPRRRAAPRRPRLRRPGRVTLPSGRVLELRRVALHAARVVVPDARGEPRELRASVPDELLGLWTALGGDPGAWEDAAACPLP